MSCSFDSSANSNEVENEEFQNEIPNKSLLRSSGNNSAKSKIGNSTIFSKNILKISVGRNQVGKQNFDTIIFNKSILIFRMRLKILDWPLDEGGVVKLFWGKLFNHCG